MEKSYNNLAYAIAKKARELGEMKMDELRIEAGYDCDSFADAIRANRHYSRGELIELVLVEEFIEEFDYKWSE